MTRRHIVVVAPPWYPVPPHGYGGTELVVALLTTELRRAGHRVELFAREDSTLDAHRLALKAWREDRGEPTEQFRTTAYAARVVARIKEMGSVDVVHDHAGVEMLLAPGLIDDVPFVHTVHGALPEPELTMYRSVDRSCDLVAISESQRRLGAGLRWVATIHNAVDTANLVVGSASEKEPYLLWLARITADKGQHVAIDVARRAGMRLVLAGKIDRRPSAKAYFDRAVAPAIDGDRVIHLHNVAGEEKARLLARATALVAPLQWEEPFGLAIVEAMASGTPAIVFARGSAPELVVDGVTGFVVQGPDEMVEAIRRVTEIDPERCAALTRSRFEPRRMMDDYLRVYEQALT